MTSDDHLRSCDDCVLYPKAPCALYFALRNEEEIETTLALVRHRTDDFKAGVRWALQLQLATRDALRTPPMCKRALHLFPINNAEYPYREKGVCIHCGFRSVLEASPGEPTPATPP